MATDSDWNVTIFIGSDFDMMSRKVIAASSLPVAKRISQVVKAFPCTRDDECPANSSHSNGLCPVLHWQLWEINHMIENAYICQWCECYFLSHFGLWGPFNQDDLFISVNTHIGLGWWQTHLGHKVAHNIFLLCKVNEIQAQKKTSSLPDSLLFIRWAEIYF